MQKKYLIRATFLRKG